VRSYHVPVVPLKHGGRNIGSIHMGGQYPLEWRADGVNVSGSHAGQRWDFRGSGVSKTRPYVLTALLVRAEERQWKVTSADGTSTHRSALCAVRCALCALLRIEPVMDPAST
jgi:hypothetical protein